MERRAWRWLQMLVKGVAPTPPPMSTTLEKEVACSQGAPNGPRSSRSSGEASGCWRYSWRVFVQSPAGWM